MIPLLLSCLLADTLTRQAASFLESGRLDRAESLSRQALESCSMPGADPVLIGRLTGNLAAVVQSQGRHEDATELSHQALARFGTRPVAEAAFVRNNLGLIHMRRGRLKEAEAEIRAALELWREVAGPASPDLARAQGNLARLYERQRGWSDAALAWNEAIRLSRENLDPSDPLVGHMMLGYARSLGHLGRKAEAGRIKREALAMLAERENNPWRRHRVDARAIVTTERR